jgi:hypothetical protein
MTGLTEDRLRAHFADRAARDVLPGPDADVAVERARQADGGPGGRAAPRNVRWLRRPRVLLAAAAAVVVAIAAAGALIATDDPARVTTDPAPAPTAPDQGPDPSTTPSTEPTTPSTSETTAPPPAGDRPTGPIVSLEGVLGTWSGSEWVRWEVGATPPSGDDYQIVRLDEPISTAVGAAGVDCSPAGLPSIDVGLGYTDEPLAPQPIAVTGVGDPRPRPVEVLDPAAPAYREAAADVVAGLGITDPAPQVSQVVRGDLDGDGAAEVVVVAERISDPVGFNAGEGDYSVAFLRRVVGGEVETSLIASSIADPRAETNPSMEVYRVSALADLNGDGRMEVVLNLRYWEGSSSLVHELQPDGALLEVLSASCGV